MYSLLVKHGQVIAFLLGVIIIGIFLAMVLPNAPGVAFDNMSDEEIANVGYFNFGLQAAIFLVVVCLIAVVLFGLYHLFDNFKNSIRSIIGFALLLVVFAIAYVMASDTATPYIQGAIDKFAEGQGATIDGTTLKLIGGGIGTAVALIIIAFLSFIIMEIINFFK